MSATHSAPSGPGRHMTGRNQLSVERKKWLVGSVGRLAMKDQPVAGERFAMDEIVRRLADEIVARHVGPNRLVAIDRAAAGRSVVIGRLRRVEPLDRHAERMEQRRGIDDPGGRRGGAMWGLRLR